MGWKVYAHVYASTRASAQGDVGAVGKGGMSTRTSAHRLCREGARHA